MAYERCSAEIRTNQEIFPGYDVTSSDDDVTPCDDDVTSCDVGWLTSGETPDSTLGNIARSHHTSTILHETG